MRGPSSHLYDDVLERNALLGALPFVLTFSQLSFGFFRGVHAAVLDHRLREGDCGALVDVRPGDVVAVGEAPAGGVLDAPRYRGSVRRTGEEDGHVIGNLS